MTDGALRRAAIAAILEEARSAVPAASLASKLGVSRQVIVGDIALLRASGADITATPRGYITGPGHAGLRRSVACVHRLPQEMEQELNIMVDNGCTVLDVVIEHAVYGQLTGELRLSSRHDVRQFMERISAEQAPPLSTLTGGVHLHTLLCPSAEACERTIKELAAAGILFE
jgi:transcriptional regulator of NAD metabolism